MALSVGDVIEGKITSIQPFGAFVDIGDGKSGMVHISEVANTYVSEIKDFIKENMLVKVKVISIAENGKISLSIKQASPAQKDENSESSVKRQKPAVKSSLASFTPKTQPEPQTFEEMMSRFKQTSDEKFSDLKRKNPDAQRSRRGGKK